MTHPVGYYRVVCRPALPGDKPDVLDLTRDIWDGEDYIPYVWEAWLADPHGLLAVAEYGGRVVGLGKLTRLGEGQWWLEGLRVHPQYQGQKISSRLHEYLLEIWGRLDGAVIRLVTGSTRYPVHHLCERTGFVKVMEYTPFNAEVIPQPTESFSPLLKDDISRAIDTIRAAPSMAYVAGMIDLGWKWAEPAPEHLSSAVERGDAWWWRGGQGLLVVWKDEEDDDRRLRGQILACQTEAIAELLLDYRRLGWRLGMPQVSWSAPLHPDLEAPLTEAGFQRAWDGSLFVFEKRCPARMV